MNCLPIVLALVLAPGTLVAGPAGPASTTGPEPVRCGGMLETVAPLSRVPGRSPIDLGLFCIVLDSSVNAEDSAYVHEVAGLLLPSLVAVLGKPHDLDTLNLRLVPGTATMGTYEPDMTMPTIRHDRGIDQDGDGRIDEDPYDGFDNDGDGRTDEDLGYDRAWDSTFIHEMAHAFHFGLVLPHELAEGFADAAQVMVAEHAATRVRRGFHHEPADWIAADDLRNRGGAQLIGGTGRLTERLDQGWAYQAAATAILLPCLAELGAGKRQPHPLARLKQALTDQRGGSSYPSYFAAMDAAWSTPVDGIFPPSRWVRSRAIYTRRLRDGIFAGVGFGYAQDGLDPRSLSLDFFRRKFGLRQGLVATTLDVRYIDADGGVVDRGPSFAVPAMGPGAYRVEVDAASAEGETASAHMWLLQTATRGPWPEGTIAAIFVDERGRPVEVPDLEVNGRILEAVPGGVVAAPRSGLEPDGALSLRSGDQHLATVTVPGPYLRVLVVPVAGGESIGPISWSPYHPGPGQPVTFLVRLDQTDAKPEDGPANVTLCGDDGSAASRSLLVETETPGIWTASLTVPESDSRFGFRIQTTETDLCYTERFDDFWAPPSEIPRRLSNPDLTFVERTGNRLTLTFEQPVDPGNLGLGYAGSPDGPWSPSATGASVSPLGDHILNWELEPLPDSARYFRVSMLGNGNPRVLFTDVLGRTVPRAGLRSVGVRPNPSPHDVVWRLEIDQPTRVRFEVFDVQGRRVHGPQDLDLEAGRREIRWNGLRDTRTGSGVYFLSLSGGGSRSVVKLVLSP